MAPQPQPRREGQKSPREFHHGYPTGTSSSSSSSFLTPTRISRTTSTAEQTPASSLDAHTAQLDRTIALDQAHQECIAEMEANHDTIINYTIRQTIEDLFRIPILILLGIFWGLAEITIIIGSILYAIVCGVAYGLGYGSVYVYYLGLYFLLWLLFVFIPIRQVMLTRPPPPGNQERPENAPHYVLFVCGSGGHTGEMIQMVNSSIRPEGRNAHRRWTIGIGDTVSYQKVLDFEKGLGVRFAATNHSPGTFDIAFFARARNVHQSWLTTPFSALQSLYDIYRTLTTAPERHPTYRHPGVIVSDGPGTGFMFLLGARLLKIFLVAGDHTMKTIFVESWARVESLSLSGKLVRFFGLADVFIVQNQDLAARYNVTYTGNMVVAPGTQQPAPQPAPET